MHKMLSLLVITLVMLISIVKVLSTININIFNDINVCNDPIHYIKREYSRFHRLGSIQEDGRSLSNSGLKHTVIFAIKQNSKALEEKLYDVSTPKSSNYRNHLSRDEVSKIGTNPTDANTVLRILSSIEGLEILSSTIDNEYITCRGDVQLFETLFQSKFSKFTYKEESALRMKEYSLPKCLSDLVGGVLNVVDLPFDLEKSSRAKAMTPTASDKNRRNLAATSNQLTSPTLAPTFTAGSPTPEPSSTPTYLPFKPTPVPTSTPTFLAGSPTPEPSSTPTYLPGKPTPVPTNAPTFIAGSPTPEPSSSPTFLTDKPTPIPTFAPTFLAGKPTPLPTLSPTYGVGKPTPLPTPSPTLAPTFNSTNSPTSPTVSTAVPTIQPTSPTLAPTLNSTNSPTSPTVSTAVPTNKPTFPTISTFSPTSFPSFNGVPVPPGCVTGLYGSTYCNNLTTIASPQFISFIYNINSNNGSTLVSQGVYEDSQLISIADLQEFEITFGLPQESITAINGGTEPGPCTAGFSECGEANLDVQYLTALAQNSPTETWWYDNTITTLFNSFIIQMANSANPPLVMSMSYGWYEGVYTSEQLTLWNTEACKLGIQGVTILAAAGDAGVAGPLGGSQGSSFCG